MSDIILGCSNCAWTSVLLLRIHGWFFAVTVLGVHGKDLLVLLLQVKLDFITRLLNLSALFGVRRALSFHFHLSNFVTLPNPFRIPESIGLNLFEA
jgi:hypothetical protein